MAERRDAVEARGPAERGVQGGRAGCGRRGPRRRGRRRYRRGLGVRLTDDGLPDRGALRQRAQRLAEHQRRGLERRGADVAVGDRASIPELAHEQAVSLSGHQVEREAIGARPGPRAPGDSGGPGFASDALRLRHGDRLGGRQRRARHDLEHTADRCLPATLRRAPSGSASTRARPDLRHRLGRGAFAAASPAGAPARPGCPIHAPDHPPKKQR
jgi:hypothetical protein